ncbi:hypothetical protein KKF38_03010, partial [Patescibacteria group bacterium]|nr:hypothetical protein [Patescibacteria group bacterium]
PKPDWILDFGYWRVEGGILTCFPKFATTIFSLFRKRGKAKQGLKKLDVDNRDGDLNFNPRGRWTEFQNIAR